jgi:hypothetical protein
VSPSFNSYTQIKHSSPDEASNNCTIICKTSITNLTPIKSSTPTSQDSSFTRSANITNNGSKGNVNGEFHNGIARNGHLRVDEQNDKNDESSVF